MKTTLLVFCLIFTTTAFGQALGGYRDAQPQIYTIPDHPLHASYSAIPSGQSVVGGGTYLIAQGDRPASDFPQLAEASLGERARELRKQHEQVKKARVVWTNQ